MYIGTLVPGIVYRVPAGSLQPAPFVTSGLQNPTGMLVVGDNLWVCDISFTTNFDKPSVLVGFDLATAAEVGRHAFSANATVCNDLASNPAGDVFATDSFANQIVTVAAADLVSNSAVVLWSDAAAFSVDFVMGFGLNGIAHNGSDAIYTVNYATGELFRVAVEANGSAGAVTVLTTQDGGGAPRALSQPDGLEYIDANTLMVAEQVIAGGDPSVGNWLATIAISDSTVTPVAGGLMAPATFVLDDNGDAWVANSQLNHFLGGTAPTLPFSVAYVPLVGD
jgi:hypothetical protein